MESNLELNYPGEDGYSLRDYLDQVERASGRHDQRLDSVIVPEDGLDIWNTFWVLNSNSEGVITFIDITSYCSLYDIELTSWELDTITSLSMCLQSYVRNENQKRAAQRK